MHVFLALSAIALHSSATVLHQIRDNIVPDLPGPDSGPIPNPLRQCTPNGAKCAGTPLQPFVKFARCCNTDKVVCGAPADLPAGLWGYFCIRAADATGILEDDGTPLPAVAPSAVPVTTVAKTTVKAKTTEKATKTEKTATTEKDSPTKKSESGTSEEKEAEDASPESESFSDGSACFPRDSTVELRDGAMRRMDEVNVGDVVKVGVGEYSPVILFTHRLVSGSFRFVNLQTAKAALKVSAGHFIYVNGALAAAQTVRVGDAIASGDGESAIVVNVDAVEGEGLFNPQTAQGDVVVDGFLSSTYTTAVDPAFAHAALGLFRILQKHLGFTCAVLEDGGGKLVDFVPSGLEIL